MAGHSRFRYDVFTDAGRVTRGDLYLLYHNVSPSQAIGTQNWLQREGWVCEVRPTAGGIMPSIATRRSHRHG